jgi:hypothetical protein
MIAPNGIQVTSYFSNVATQTTDYSASVQDSGIFVNAVSGNLVVTLPPISSAFDSPYGIILSVKKVDATTNLVTIVGSGSDTVEGVANYILGAQNASVTLQASASGWLAVASVSTGGSGGTTIINENSTYLDGGKANSVYGILSLNAGGAS